MILAVKQFGKQKPEGAIIKREDTYKKDTRETGWENGR
jgi:hypothetical protein